MRGVSGNRYPYRDRQSTAPLTPLPTPTPNFALDFADVVIGFLLGTHDKVESKHLPHYVAEFNYRLNRRSMEADLMIRLLRACIGAHTITYKQLIAMPELT